MPPTLRHTVRALALLSLALSQQACIIENTNPSLTKEERVAMHYENALRYYEMDDLERALDQAQRGLEADSRDRKLQLLTGWILVRRKTRESVATAEEIFRDLLSEDDYRVQLGLSICLERKGMFYDEAARSLDEEASDGSPDRRATRYRREAQGAWAEAIERYGLVLVEQAGDRDALNGLMRTEALRGNDQESLARSDQLIATVSQHTQFWTGQLVEDISVSREKQIREWIDDDSTLLVKVHLHRASVMRRLDRHAEAATELEQVIELDPDIPEVHSRLAQEFFDLARYRDARTSIDRYLALSSDAFDDTNYQRAWELRNRADAALTEQESVTGR